MSDLRVIMQFAETTMLMAPGDSLRYPMLASLVQMATSNDTGEHFGNFVAQRRVTICCRKRVVDFL